MPGLPIPVPPDAASGAGIRCVVTPVDRDGRLAARSVLTFMGWSAGHAVELAIEPGPIVVARTGRTVRINPRGAFLNRRTVASSTRGWLKKG